MGIRLLAIEKNRLWWMVNNEVSIPAGDGKKVCFVKEYGL